MKIVVIGAKGLARSKLVQRLRDKGHEVLATSRAWDVDPVVYDGLADALGRAQMVVDMASSPSFKDRGVRAFLAAKANKPRAIARGYARSFSPQPPDTSLTSGAHGRPGLFSFTIGSALR